VILDFCGLEHAKALTRHRTIMSIRNLAVTRARRPADRYLAISLSALAIGLAPQVLAQPSLVTFSDTISFTGSGNLPVSQTTYALGGVPDPAVSVSLTGTGVEAAAAVGGGTYFVDSGFNTTATISLPGSTVPSFSASQPYFQGSPAGADPGINMDAQYFQSSNPNAPFYGLFPMPAGSDPFTFIPATGVQSIFSYSTESLSVGFGADTADGSDGEADLFFANPPSKSAVPDPSLPGYDIYTFTYNGAQLGLTPDIGQADPYMEFTGTAKITVVAAAVPDSSVGLTGLLVLTGVCAAGASKKFRAA
jgi:hypothetical protein